MEFKSYDSLEDMQTDMAFHEQIANEAVTDQQRRISFGDHYAKPLGPDYDYMFVFGRVSTIDEIVASEVLAVTEFAGRDARKRALKLAAIIIDEAGVGEDHELSLGSALRGAIPLEYDDGAFRLFATAARTHGVNKDQLAEGFDILSSVRDRHLRGYRFGKAYSLIVPDGEYGDSHVTDMIPLRPAEFDDARAAGWDFNLLAMHSSPHTQPWAQQLVMAGAPACFKRNIAPEGARHAL